MKHWWLPSASLDLELTENAMVLAALIIYLVWALLAFGLRSLLQWRRTGDTGFRGTGLPVGSVQWWAVSPSSRHC
jgi:hypothetical protein